MGGDGLVCVFQRLRMSGVVLGKVSKMVSGDVDTEQWALRTSVEEKIVVFLVRVSFVTKWALSNFKNAVIIFNDIKKN